MRRREFLATAAAAIVMPVSKMAAAAERHLLYIAEPGIRNYVDYGGVGVLVYDIGNGYKFVKRIPTWTVPAGQEPDNVKGVAASAKTGRLYRQHDQAPVLPSICVTEKVVWDSRAGRRLRSPGDLAGRRDALRAVVRRPALERDRCPGRERDREGDHQFRRAQHRIFTGRHPRLSGRVEVAGAVGRRHEDPYRRQEQSARSATSIRPFTVNAAQTLVYVNVNELLGFEIGDLTTGKVLHKVEVQGFQKGPVKRHGCPSHGVGLTPDETELWLCDGHNNAVHVFDNTVMPPKQMTSITVRDQPGWVTFSIDGRHAYPSTGEVFDTRTKKLVTALQDEQGRQVGSEKLLEIVFAGPKPVSNGDQFGLGTRKS